MEQHGQVRERALSAWVHRQGQYSDMLGRRLPVHLRRSSRNAGPRNLHTFHKPSFRLVLPTEVSDLGSLQQYFFRWPGESGDDGLCRLAFGRHPVEEEDVGDAKGPSHLFSRFHSMSRHESKGCHPLLGALPSFINQLEGRSISTRRFPVDESTVRLFFVVFESLAVMVKGMCCHRFPQSSHPS